MISPEAVAAFKEKFDNSTYDDLDPASYDRAVAEALKAAFAAAPVSEPEPVAKRWLLERTPARWINPLACV